MTDKEYNSFAERVWDVLSNVDTEPHVEVIESSGNRPDVKYLPWHKAWMLLKREFPASTYHHAPDLIHKADSVEVEVFVDIRSGESDGDLVVSSARLAVMDHRFNAILCPDSTQINKSRQRCLVKALAFAGLGLNLWSESALPVGSLLDPINVKQIGVLEQLLEQTGVNKDLYCEWLGVECLTELPRELYPKAKLHLEQKLS